MYPPLEFFPDVRMNFAEHLLDSETLNEVALYAVSEGCEVIRPVTKPELREMVKAVASAMAQAGVTVGDRVAAVISNCTEAIVACLAVLSLGALWSTSSPDMGVEGIMQRLNQIEPKIVLFESSVRYNGKRRPLLQKSEECLSRLRKTRNFELGVMIVREVPYPTKDKSNIVSWGDFVKGAPDRELTFVQLPFKQPGFIVYSSGTASHIQNFGDHMADMDIDRCSKVHCSQCVCKLIRLGLDSIRSIEADPVDSGRQCCCKSRKTICSI
jgi:acetoacetyl-CoA synthetase